MTRQPSTTATVKRAYARRYYPTAEQERLLLEWFGVSRFAWNVALEMMGRAYKDRNERLTYVGVSKQFTQLKRDPNFEWFAAPPSDVLDQTLRDLDRAFANFFAKRAKYPKWKSRKNPKHALRFVFDQRHAGKVREWNKGTLVLPKLGALKLRGDALPAAMPKMVTVRRDAAGRWFVSFVVDEAIQPLPTTGSLVGVDLGVNDAMVVSDGSVVENPRHLNRHQRKLRKEQRRLARKTKGSNRYAKQRQRVAKVHAKVADARNDYLHKATTALVKSHDLIAAEDLNVRGMMANRRLARAISDVGFSEIRRQLDYKGGWYGREIRVIDRWAPTSKTCSACGHRMAEMPLSVREWDCLACGAHHDRDVNAAKNILSFALGGGTAEVMRVEGDTHREPLASVSGERHPMKREPWQTEQACLEQAAEV